MYTRVAWQTGIWRNVNARGIVVSTTLLAKGASGPSAIFRIHGASHPERPAFIFEGRTHTYGDFNDRIDRLAAGLRKRGIRKGDSAVLMLKNRPECIEIGSALSRLGASGVSVSWRSTPAELTYLVNHSGSSAVFFEHELWPTIRATLPDFKLLAESNCFPVGGDVPGRPSLEELHDVGEPGPARKDEEGTVVIYTSGTTGKPKGAVRKFASGQLEGFFAFIGETPMRADDRHLTICPLYHSTGLGFAGMTMILGGTVVILREFDPELTLRTIERERITTLAIVPTMLHRWMALPDAVFAKYDTSSLRAIFCGGAQLPGPLALRTMERLGPVLYNFYGATETGLVTVANPAELRAAPGTIGHAVPGNDIRLLDESGHEVKRGDVGELFVKNSMIVEGYHADADATRASMRDGYFSVGDLAMQDDAGRYHIVGRQRDMVISGGVNIYPAEIEETLHQHPAVSQAAVIGVPDDEWGERLRAFIVLKSGATASASDLRGHCRAVLSGPKVPKEWVFLDALPSNPTGKILKRELRAWDGVPTG